MVENALLQYIVVFIGYLSAEKETLVFQTFLHRITFYIGVMDRDTNDVSLIRFVNRMSILAGHSPIV